MAKLQMGLVGGGEGAFIGAVHRMAAELDGRIALACGAFSSDPARSRQAGVALYGIDAERSYGTYDEMMATEAGRPDDDRMDFVVIATPNHTHHPIARAALQAGFHVMSDKPATFDLAEAKELAALAGEKDLVFGLTHNYTGLPDGEGGAAPGSLRCLRRRAPGRGRVHPGLVGGPRGSNRQ